MSGAPKLAAAVLLLVAVAACEKDRFDPNTWIEQLDNPIEADKAVTELHRLKDPVAIAPLGKYWESNNRPERVLRVIVDLAEPKAQEDGTMGPDSWAAALPFLRTALDDLDVGDPQSVENAKLAAHAIGQANDKESLELLTSVVKKKMPKLSTGQEVRRAAITALGQFGTEARAVESLIQVIDAEPDAQPPQIFAAAVDALGVARSVDAMPYLLEALYRIPVISAQCRRALVAIGKPAIPELIKILNGRHKKLNELAKELEFNINCEAGFGPESKCKAPTNLEYKAASLLGDLYAKEAVKSLTATLSKPALPAFFFPNGSPGPSQHTAVLDALRKINDESATSAVRAYWQDPKTDDIIRPLAIDVYSFITTSTQSLPELAKLTKDDGQDEQIRLASGQAYARLARAKGEFGPLEDMVKRYRREANKNQSRADKEVAKLKKAQEAHKRAKEAADAAPDDSGKAKALSRAEESLAKAERSAGSAENKVLGYRRFQRVFEQNLARAHAAATCKKDPSCYATLMGKSGEEIGGDMGKSLQGFDKWTPEEKSALKLAATERALLELIKLKDKARPAMSAVMEQVSSTERMVRQGSLLVMVHGAELPCGDCVTKLDEVYERQKDQSTLRQLSMETQVTRNYFLWAGKE